MLSGVSTVPLVRASAGSAVKYTFSPFRANTMLLIPDAAAQDTRPAYHISVGMDCLHTKKVITTIARGASEDGDHVASFESTTNIWKDGFVNMHRNGFGIKSVFPLKNIPMCWTSPKVKFYWHRLSRAINAPEHGLTCYLTITRVPSKMLAIPRFSLNLGQTHYLWALQNQSDVCLLNYL